MELEPVRHLPRPEYPTRNETQSQGAWLLAHLPENWRRMVAAGGTGLVLLAAGMGGCDGGSRPPGQKQGQAVSAPGKGHADIATVVAPIFEHGEGRGAIGCVVIAPPVFLSEDDALGIIQDELGKLGIKLTGKRAALPGVSIRGQVERWETKGDDLVVRQEADGTSRPLELQLVDSQRRVGIGFVGRANYHAVGGPGSGSTVQVYDFQKQAAAVAGAVKEESKGFYVGVLYDPAGAVRMPPPPADEKPGIEAMKKRMEAFRQRLRRTEEAGRAVSREELRKQVRDLAAWLRQQGAV